MRRSRQLVGVLGLCVLAEGPQIVRAQTHSDIPYLPGGTEKQRLDLYLPEQPPEGMVAVLLVHGGSLTSGDRREEPWPEACRAFNASGIACATVSYRLFPDVDWPAPVEDVAAAFAWLAENASSYGIRRDAIALVGHSSGCLLATMVGSNPALLAGHGLAPSDILGVVALGCRLGQTPPDTAGVPSERIAQAFAAGGRYERFRDLATLRSYYPLEHIGAHLPPFLALIAEEERFKPPILEDAARYVGIARDCRVDADLRILGGHTHMSAATGLASRDDPSHDSVVDFVTRLAEEGPRRHLADPDRCPR